LAHLKAVNSCGLDTLVESVRLQLERGGGFPPDCRRDLAAVVEHAPEDLTITVQAGMLLRDLQAHLRSLGQWLPVDPFESTLTIGALVEGNHFGPRRHAHGTIRDHLIGLAVITGEGELVRNGGKVVKNVAGYDLLKLFTGSSGSLGRVVEATFKLLPLPEDSKALHLELSSLGEAAPLRAVFNTAQFQPAWLNLVVLTDGKPVFSVGFEGVGEDVAEQTSRALDQGLRLSEQPLHAEARFHSACPSPIWRSFLPSKLPGELPLFGPGPFMAWLGAGVVACKSGAAPTQPSPPSAAELAIARRLKAAFDPNGVLPPLPYEPR
jgi:FAD/FMN-containing dehydrogenase